MVKGPHSGGLSGIDSSADSAPKYTIASSSSNGGSFQVSSNDVQYDARTAQGAFVVGANTSTDVTLTTANSSVRVDASADQVLLPAAPIYRANLTQITTAGDATYTAAQCLAGIIDRDPAGGSRSDTLPTAALLVAAIPRAAVGDVVQFFVHNDADAAETITLAAGTGGAWAVAANDPTVTQNQASIIYLRLTNVTSASEAYVGYSLVAAHT